MGVDFTLQRKQVKQKPICTAVFVPSGSWGAQEFRESQPGSSQQHFYCLCCCSCKGSSSPALLHLSVGFLSLTHRRHAGRRAFFLLKTTAAQQKSRRKVQLEGQVLAFHFLLQNQNDIEYSCQARSLPEECCLNIHGKHSLGFQFYLIWDFFSVKRQEIKWHKVQKLQH